MKNNKKLNLIQSISTYAIFGFPLFFVRVNSFLVIIWSILSFLIFIINNPKIEKSAVITFSLLPIYLLGYLISPFFSDNLSGSLFQLEKRIFLLVFPLFFLLAGFSIDENKKKISLICFSISCLLICIIGSIHITNLNGWVNFSEVDSFKNIYREEISNIMSTHPTYLGLSFVFGSFIAVEYAMNYFKNKSDFKFGILLSFISLILIFFTILIAVRIALIALVIISPIYIFMKIKKKKNAIIVGILSLAFFLLLTYFTPSIYSRFEESFKTSLTPPKGKHHNSTNIRVAIYSCCIELLESNWLFGFGGELQNNLNTCLSKFKTEAFKIKDYNTHNQYFHSWLSFGIFGFLIYILIIFSSIYLAIKYKNSLFLVFILLCAIFSLTENILSIQKGVIFFSLFYSFFINNIYQSHIKKYISIQ
ncbi:O-antigen ligase family protein [Chondrinema litorale]|uniref:O-antigen ligase family protein n=1 Tax=Chondrinema litorale TaxID=2994555 RepID=UPI0025433C10|nr:O-antigen ligase family protein [Chondrinema litorale]UZR94357.1 O-antigen ligase family protein [Chondrinema litorale]